MSFSWSEGSQRYRDLTTGRFVPTSQVNNAVEAVIRSAGERMVGFSQQLQEGSMSISQWQAAMVAELKPLHVGAAAMGRGGWAQMGQSEYGWTGSALKKQYGFLRNFAHDIATGKQPMDGRLLQRTRMYASAAAGTQREMARRTGQAIGRTEERNVLGATDRHCSQCVSCTAQGWVPIGSLPPVGSRICVSMCRCTIQTRVMPGTASAAVDQLAPLEQTVVQPATITPALTFEQRMASDIDRALSMEALGAEDAQWLRSALAGKEGVSRPDLEKYHNELLGYITKKQAENLVVPARITNWASDPGTALAPQDGLKQTVSTTENTALGRYKGTEFANINTFLRTGDVTNVPRYSTSEKYQQSLKDAVNGIDSVMARTPLAAPVRVYRGVTFEKGSDQVALWNAMTPGTIMTDPGYMSTTLRTDGANFGALGTAFSHGFSFEIVVPQGTKGIYLDPFGVPQKGKYGDEREILLGRDTRLLIHKIVPGDKVTTIVAEVLP